MTVATDIIEKLLSLVDQSNWDEMPNATFCGYREAMEVVQQVIEDFQQKAYDERKTLGRPVAQ